MEVTSSHRGGLSEILGKWSPSGCAVKIPPHHLASCPWRTGQQKLLEGLGILQLALLAEELKAAS